MIDASVSTYKTAMTCFAFRTSYLNEIEFTYTAEGHTPCEIVRGAFIT